MKAKEIWIAVHPDDPTAFEVYLEEPNGMGTCVYSHETKTEKWVEWVRYAAIPMED